VDRIFICAAPRINVWICRLVDGFTHAARAVGRIGSFLLLGNGLSDRGEIQSSSGFACSALRRRLCDEEAKYDLTLL